MRIAIFGADSVGGYFGGRLTQVGEEEVKSGDWGIAGKGCTIGDVIKFCDFLNPVFKV